MKKLFVLLLCLLAVFAIVSCKNEPKQEGDTTPKPTDEDILSGKAYYHLTATMQAKRFSFLYAGGADEINPKAGDVITLKYRSEHPVTYLYLRNEDTSVAFLNKYEILESDDPYVSTADADGWFTLTFTYPEAPSSGTYDATDGTVSGFLLEIANYDQKFQVDDYLEIKDFAFNGEKLLVEGPETVKDATGYQSDHGVWNRGNGDQTEPVLERVFIDSEKK